MSVLSDNNMNQYKGDYDNFYSWNVSVIGDLFYAVTVLILFFLSFLIFSYFLLKTYFFYEVFTILFCVTAQWLLPKRKNKI
jgi:ABC-type multidrug transport system permease subunit